MLKRTILTLCVLSAALAMPAVHAGAVEESPRMAASRIFGKASGWRASFEAKSAKCMRTAHGGSVGAAQELYRQSACFAGENALLSRKFEARELSGGDEQASRAGFDSALKSGALDPASFAVSMELAVGAWALDAPGGQLGRSALAGCSSLWAARSGSLFGELDEALWLLSSIGGREEPFAREGFDALSGLSKRAMDSAARCVVYAPGMPTGASQAQASWQEASAASWILEQRSRLMPLTYGGGKPQETEAYGLE